MTTSSQTILLTLPQVIDVALTAPELGMVSFNLLNNILQVMCNQLNLNHLKLQYEGVQAKKIQRVLDLKFAPKLPSLPSVSHVKSPEGLTEKLCVIPESTSEKYPATSMVISSDYLNKLDKKIDNLRDEFQSNKDLPSNAELFSVLRSENKESTTPIVDSIHVLTLIKRMDAMDETMAKITDLIEDFKKTFPESPKADEDIEDKLKDINQCYCPDEKNESDKEEKTQKIKEKKSKSKKLSEDLDDTSPKVVLQDELSAAFTPSKPKGEAKSSRRRSDGSTHLSLREVTMSEMTSLQAFNLVQYELISLRTLVESYGTQINELKFKDFKLSLKKEKAIVEPLQQEILSTKSLDPTLIDDNNKIDDTDKDKDKFKDKDSVIKKLERKIYNCITQINDIDAIFSTSYNEIINRLNEVETMVRLLSDKSSKEAEYAEERDLMQQNIFNLTEKIIVFEENIGKLSEAISLLLNENTSKDNKFKILLDSVDYIKSDKIGREELSDALAEKVDLCMINRKVSNDQFNATCDYLSKGIEEALLKLMEQEELWHGALSEIQEEIHSKLGKDDLKPLKKFVVTKLEGLKHRVNLIKILKNEQEAAFSKSKYLKDVTCISCDKQVLMKKKIDVTTNYPTAPIFPTRKTIAPFVTYELEQMRKQKKIIPRYCGGQHTLTTPQQRVGRLTNTLEIWQQNDTKQKELSNKAVETTQFCLVQKKNVDFTRCPAEKEDNRVAEKQEA